MTEAPKLRNEFPAAANLVTWAEIIRAQALALPPEVKGLKTVAQLLSSNRQLAKTVIELANRLIGEREWR